MKPLTTYRALAWVLLATLLGTLLAVTLIERHARLESNIDRLAAP